jgi:hypothetical protein
MPRRWARFLRHPPPPGSSTKTSLSEQCATQETANSANTAADRQSRSSTRKTERSLVDHEGALVRPHQEVVELRAKGRFGGRLGANRTTQETESATAASASIGEGAPSVSRRSRGLSVSDAASNGGDRLLRPHFTHFHYTRPPLTHSVLELLINKHSALQGAHLPRRPFRRFLAPHEPPHRPALPLSPPSL